MVLGISVSLAAAAIGVGVMLIGSLGSVRRPRRILLTGLGAFAVTALALMLVTRGFLKPQSTSPYARIVASIPGGPVEIARWLWNRDRYGTAAVQMIREFPVAGIGIGTFHSIGVDYTKSVGGVALPPDNAQNWYRHQMAELGILGSLGWLAFCGLFAIAVIRTPPERRSVLTRRRPPGLTCHAGRRLARGHAGAAPGHHPDVLDVRFLVAAAGGTRLQPRPGRDDPKGSCHICCSTTLRVVPHHYS